YCFLVFSVRLPPTSTLFPYTTLFRSNGMPRFFRRLAEGVFDEEDLKKNTYELADFVSAAAQHYEFPADQIVAVGYSNGANIAARDRKSTRLNSSHVSISYAVFCLKKK